MLYYTNYCSRVLWKTPTERHSCTVEAPENPAARPPGKDVNCWADILAASESDDSRLPTPLPLLPLSSQEMTTTTYSAIITLPCVSITTTMSWQLHLQRTVPSSHYLVCQLQCLTVPLRQVSQQVKLRFTVNMCHMSHCLSTVNTQWKRPWFNIIWKTCNENKFGGNHQITVDQNYIQYTQNQSMQIWPSHQMTAKTFTYLFWLISLHFCTPVSF